MWFGVDKGLAGIKFSGSRNIIFNELDRMSIDRISRINLDMSFNEKKFLNEILSLLMFRFRFLDEPIW